VTGSEGHADFEGDRTWYRVEGDIEESRRRGLAPLVTLHGGPGATHDYLLSMTDLAAAGLRSVVLSNTAASFAAFAEEANGLRAALPPEVEATLRRHEEAGTTADPGYAAACEVFYARHVCRTDPMPAEVVASFAMIDEDPTVYHTTNGPSEFHVIGSFRDWSAADRLGRITAPTLVISGRHDEATPALQATLVAGIAGSEQVILEDSSHMPFWEEREAYMAAVDGFLRRHD
jgi:L-proline amide hydrolase